MPIFNVKLSKDDIDVRNLEFFSFKAINHGGISGYRVFGRHYIILYYFKLSEFRNLN